LSYRVPVIRASGRTGLRFRTPLARRSRRQALVASATVVAVALGGLVVVRLATGDSGGGRPPGSAQQAAGRLRHCGPLKGRDVHGSRASHLPRRVTRFWGDEAVCRGMWLGGRAGYFVPQGLAVDGRTAWVTGYDGSARRSKRACRLLKIDLRRLEVVASHRRLTGAVPGRGATYCRHGGAVVADGPKRLWVIETRRLWLLDPRLVGRKDPVRRVWRLEDGVRGSVGVMVPGKGLGLGRHAQRGRIDWFDPQRLRRSHRTILRASRTERAPRGLQGLTYGRLRPGGRPGVWLTRGVRGCGFAVLQGPWGQRLPIAPGAEGLGFDGRGGMWVLSEASVRKYFDRGDPVVPQLLRYSVADLARQVGLEGGQRKVRRCLS
jgi:hypothetical protein